MTQFARLARTLVVVLVLTVITSSVGAQAPCARPGDELLGLWGAEALLGPQVRGDIVLERNEKQWTARVAGFEIQLSSRLTASCYVFREVRVRHAFG